MFFAIFTKTIEKHKENQKKQSKNKKNIRKTKKNKVLKDPGQDLCRFGFFGFFGFPKVFWVFDELPCL